MNKMSLSIYEKNICTINNSISIYQYLQVQAKNLDTTILLRSQFVLIVSAFDTYVHSLIIDEVMTRFFSNNPEIEANIDIPLALAFQIKNVAQSEQREKLFIFLKNKLSKDSFQSPKSIEYAFSMIGINKLWSQIATQMNMSAEDIKDTLAVIVKRRNKIAHESDWNNVTGTYEEIEIKDVVQCKNFIDKLVNALDNIIK